MLPRLDDGPARTTEGIGHEAVVETDAFLGNPVEVGSGRDLTQSPAVGGNRLVGMIVGKDKDDVWSTLGGCLGLRRQFGGFLDGGGTVGKIASEEKNRCGSEKGCIENRVSWIHVG